MPSPDLDIHPAVADALSAGRPVIAIASSPLSHTLPWPSNLETSRAAHEAAKAEGAMPALIAIRNGRLTIGLDDAEAESLMRDKDARRASRRDLAGAVLKGWNAGTTVSATMAIADLADIRLVACGAIGTARPPRSDLAHFWDVSSDLVELSQTKVAVVCSGVRSASQMNYASAVLDTFRVPVVGYRTDALPTFYMTLGSCPISVRVDSPADAAGFLEVHWRNAGAGAVLAQPTPADVAISPDQLIPALRAVEEQAERDGVDRKDFSPFMMDKLNRLTWGKAVKAYQAILIANARLAAQVAREMRQKS